MLIGMRKKRKPISRKVRDELVNGIALRYARLEGKRRQELLYEAEKDTGDNRKYLYTEAQEQGIHQAWGYMSAKACRRDDLGRKKRWRWHDICNDWILPFSPHLKLVGFPAYFRNINVGAL